MGDVTVHYEPCTVQAASAKTRRPEGSQLGGCMNSKKWRQIPGVVAAGLLGLFTAPCALAQLTNAQALIENPLLFNPGAFIVSTDVKARLNGTSTTNPDVDFADTFGTASDETRA